MSQVGAESIAARQLRSLTRVEGTRLVVNALGDTQRLAWEATVEGFGADGISRLTVDVDAITFFFQAEDGIRDKLVTGVQTCALPICSRCIGCHTGCGRPPD